MILSKLVKMIVICVCTWLLCRAVASAAEPNWLSPSHVERQSERPERLVAEQSEHVIGSLAGRLASYHVWHWIPNTRIRGRVSNKRGRRACALAIGRPAAQ
jgi:hypothetical protein